MRLRVSGIHRRGRNLSLTISAAPGSGRVTVLAGKGHHQVRLGVAHRSRHNTVLTFTAKLSPGRWTVTVACKPPRGYATPKPKRLTVTIPR